MTQVLTKITMPSKIISQSLDSQHLHKRLDVGIIPVILAQGMWRWEDPWTC